MSVDCDSNIVHHKKSLYIFCNRNIINDIYDMQMIYILFFTWLINNIKILSYTFVSLFLINLFFLFSY